MLASSTWVRRTVARATSVCYPDKIQWLSPALPFMAVKRKQAKIGNASLYANDYKVSCKGASGAWPSPFRHV